MDVYCGIQVQGWLALSCFPAFPTLAFCVEENLFQLTLQHHCKPAFMKAPSWQIVDFFWVYVWRNIVPAEATASSPTSFRESSKSIRSGNRYSRYSIDRLERYSTGWLERYLTDQFERCSTDRLKRYLTDRLKRYLTDRLLHMCEAHHSPLQRRMTSSSLLGNAVEDVPYHHRIDFLVLTKFQLLPPNATKCYKDKSKSDGPNESRVETQPKVWVFEKGFGLPPLVWETGRKRDAVSSWLA